MKKTKQIPLEDFFKNPDTINYIISPDGKNLTYLKPWVEGNRILNVYMKNLSNNQEKRLTNNNKRNIVVSFWLSDNRIGYVQDKDGDENYHLYGVNINGGNNINLTPFNGSKIQLINILEKDENNILIGLNKRNKQVFDAYKLNVNNRELTLIAKNPGNITSWLADHNGKLRLALTTDGINSSILYRENENGKFETILTTDYNNDVDPLFFTFDNKNIYVSSNRNRDKSAIFLFDLKKKKETKLIYEHKTVDVVSLLMSDKRKKITGAGFTDKKQECVFFDKERKDIQNKIDSKLSPESVKLLYSSKNEDVFLVREFSDKNFATHYIYDVNKDQLTKLQDSTPWLKKEDLTEMKPISYKSRDGLTINGYLSLPKDKPKKNLPIVINPHGGPWVRDSWCFNPEVQFLCNRGFGVLQMNYRGSTGYGKDFWKKSFKQWGKTMQDDITDGVNWLIKEEIADPKRIAIYGASYGGYATLAGLTFTPDLYACGIDYIGVSNLFTFLDSIPPDWELYREMMYELIGHPVDDKELLTSSSPALNADRIKAPLFIAQGANDPRVKKSESDQMVEALRKNGIDVPYMVKDDEGHGFVNEKNKFDFYKEMIKFLNKHIG
ncbi:S9 family peptidase [Flavobacteriales bacterium]|nr:S9 family peptidase [Flavobacteriales bacterium]